MNLDMLYGNEPPEFLFHYTSSVGMLGILANCCIWATEARYLNDEKELSNTLDFVLFEVSRRMEQVAEFDAEVLSQFQVWLRERISSGHALFVVSLTENGNLLSQWRGYTPSTTGVSLGFSSSKLAQKAIASGFRLGRCIYDRQEQQEIVQELINEILAAAANFVPAKTNDHHPSQRHYTLFETLEERIFLGAALLKHHSFKEEAEWRLVSSFVREYRSAPINFRPGSSCLIPYLEFDLKDESEELTVLRRVYVGPTPNPNLAMHSVTMALSKHISGSHIVVNSMLPLRQI